MAAACPVVFKRVDEYQVRAHALIVVFVTLGFVWFEADWLPVLLVYDFFVRVVFSPKASPLFHVSRGVVRLLPLTAKPVDAGPKMFAAKVGLFIAAGGLAFVLLGYVEVSLWLMTLMAFFAALEAACGLCVGCKLYTLFSPLFMKRP